MDIVKLDLSLSLLDVKHEKNISINQKMNLCNLLGNWVGGGRRRFRGRCCLRPRGGGRPIIIHQHHFHTQVIDHTDYTRIRELETQLEECKKHRREVEIKINEIITTHVNIKDIANKMIIIDEVDKCLKLLGVEYNDKDGLMEKLKKLVNACKNLTLTGPVQERLWKCLAYMYGSKAPKTLEAFTSNFDKNMDKLTEACFRNKKQELYNDVRYKGKAFVPKPDSSFVRKLCRCHYYIVGRSKEKSIVNMIDNLLQACKNFY
ncbi:7856_t:CDS:2 [Dentiscutata erythropus]|uniref:7856_t:CDS:1 n=1 Tax=Dentiscutata erythropus TaxID=1348616 RepID=A0A9N9F297_9GLOM|nr:7856_t:CDS:2 [Dentiscutata erythropus]